MANGLFGGMGIEVGKIVNTVVWWSPLYIVGDRHSDHNAFSVENKK